MERLVSRRQEIEVANKLGRLLPFAFLQVAEGRDIRRVSVPASSSPIRTDHVGSKYSCKPTFHNMSLSIKRLKDVDQRIYVAGVIFKRHHLVISEGST